MLAVLRSISLLIALCAVCGLAPPPADAQPAPGPAQPMLERLTIIAPAAPGGGWDQTARAMQYALETEQLVGRVQVENVPGAAGTIGLAQFVTSHRGRGDALLVNGLVMLGAILWNESPLSLEQVTPIARLTGEYEVIAVNATSPHRSINSLVDALRLNPRGVSWGGGSAGGTDHILAGLVVAAAGVDPRRTNYVAFSGGGEAVASLLGGNVTAGISGYSEFAPHIESGRLRALAISSSDRIAGIGVPTLREQSLDVELANWRAVMAPPGISDAQRAVLTDMLARLVRTPTWQRTLADRDWIDAFLAGEPFGRFLTAERTRVTRIVARLRGPSGAGTQLNAGEWIFPVLVFSAALVSGILLVGQRSKVRGQTESRESRVPVNSRALLWTSAGLLLFLATLNFAGFIVASSLLFVCVTAAFGSRRLVRDVAIAVLFGVILYVTFTRGLGLVLPDGPW